MSQHYDVAILGNQTAGLIAAALLAKKGRRVLLLDHSEATTHYSRKGFRLPLVPVLLPHFESSATMQEINDQLGITPYIRAASSRQQPSFQAVMPRARIDITHEPKALVDELKLEFPELAAPVEQFFTQLTTLNEDVDRLLQGGPPLPTSNPFKAWWQRRRLAPYNHLNKPFEDQGLLAAIPDEHPVRELLLGPLSFFGNMLADHPSTLHAARLIGRYFQGTLAFSDPLTGLQTMLIEAAKRAGVDVHQQALVRDIHTKGRRVLAITVDSERTAHTADFFINNTQTGLAELLPKSRHQGRLALQEQAAKPTGSLLVLNVLVRREVIPCGMGRALFLLNGRRHHRDEHAADPPLLVERYSAQLTDSKSKHAKGFTPDEANEVLSIACPVTTRDIEHSPEVLARTKIAMLARIKRLVPFLDEFVVDTSLPVDTSSWDLEDEHTRRHIDPWRIYPLFERPDSSLFGITVRGPTTAFKNLVHCGTDIFPGLGLEGAYLAGQVAASAVTQLAGSKWQKAKSR